MSANQADVSVKTMCRMLDVSTSGYYAWRDRTPSRRSIDDAVMTERIRTIHAESHTTYGMPRVRAELRDQGVIISRKRVARLMRCAKIRGVSRRRGYVVTTRRDARQRPAPDLVNRKFTAAGPNQLWVADMTYVPTWAGFIYLATVLDVWSRRIVGWSIGERMTADLVTAALDRRWVPSAMPTTTRWPRASSPASNASCSIGPPSRPRPKRGSPCSPTSKAGTTRAAVTAHSTTDHRPTSNAITATPFERPDRTPVPT